MRYRNNNFAACSRLMTDVHDVNSLPEEMITTPENIAFREWVCLGRNKEGIVQQVFNIRTDNFGSSLEDEIKRQLTHQDWIWARHDYRDLIWYELEITTKFKKGKEMKLELNLENLNEM